MSPIHPFLPTAASHSLLKPSCLLPPSQLLLNAQGDRINVNTSVCSSPQGSDPAAFIYTEASEAVMNSGAVERSPPVGGSPLGAMPCFHGSAEGHKGTGQL